MVLVPPFVLASGNFCRGFLWKTISGQIETIKRLRGLLQSVTSRESQLPSRTKIFARVYFCGLAIFCVLRELILRFSGSSQYPALIKFSFMLSTCRKKYIFSNNTTVCVPYVKLVFHCIPFCFWMKEASCSWMNRHDFLVLYFCVANLKNIYCGVNFCG